MNHTCIQDERGNCEQCENIKREQEWKDYKFQAARKIMAEDLPILEEFPTPYEFGKMESGEWN